MLGTIKEFLERANHTPTPLAGSQTISRAFNNGDREQITLPPVPRARKVRGQAGPLTPGVPLRIWEYSLGMRRTHALPAAGLVLVHVIL